MIEALAYATFEASLANAPSGLAGTIGVRIVDPDTRTIVLDRVTSAISEFPTNSGFYIAQLPAPGTPGDYLILWDIGDLSPTSTGQEVLRVGERPGTPSDIPITATDVRVLVPRVRRAVEGVGMPAGLTDDQMKDLVADAIADVILLTGGVFGKQLLVTATDQSIPTEYATDQPLSLPEGSVIAAQAALNHLGRELATLKTGETIRDEGQEWTWSTSASALSQRIQDLRNTRDQALAMVQAKNYVPVTFTSFLAERDRWVANLVEPPFGQRYYGGFLCP